jgi:hypothetical protein
MAVPTAASTPSASATAPSPTITLSVSPARGGTNGSFTVSGGGCPEAGDQIDIMWDNHALVPEAHCSAAHRFSQTYTPTNGELDWATPAGQYAKWTVTAGSHAIQANNQASTGLFVTETIHYTVTG